MGSFEKVRCQCGSSLFCLCLSSFLTSQVDVVAVLWLPADATSLLATAEYCPARRRRKRSVREAISEAYSGLYDGLIERDAMENVLTFDLNRDGLISLEEAMETRGNNDTIKEFKQVDVDNDGYVHPSEFDQSLV